MCVCVFTGVGKTARKRQRMKTVAACTAVAHTFTMIMAHVFAAGFKVTHERASVHDQDSQSPFAADREMVRQ